MSYPGVIYDKFKKVIDEFKVIDNVDNEIEKCFKALKATNSFVDYLSIVLPQQNPASNENINVFVCIDACADFLLLNAISPNQVYPLLISLLPLLMSCSGLFSLHNNFCSVEYTAAWSKFQKEFLSIYEALHPFEFRQQIAELLSSLDILKTTIPITEEIITNFQNNLNEFQRVIEINQTAESFTQMLANSSAFKKTLFEIVAQNKGRDWSGNIQPQFLAAIKIFEDNMVIARIICNLHDTVIATSNSHKIYHPTNNHTTRAFFIQASLKLLAVVIRYLSMQTNSEEENKWLFECIDIIMQMQSVLNINDGEELEKKWKKLIDIVDNNKLEIDLDKEDDEWSRIISAASLFPINYPTMSIDILRIGELYKQCCMSTKNYNIAHQIYNLLSSAIEASTNAEFTEAVLKFRKTFSRRLVYIYFTSIIAAINPFVLIVASESNQRTPLQAVTMLMDACHKVATSDSIAFRGDSHFMASFISYLKFIKLIVPTMPELATQMLSWHPTVDNLSNFITFTDGMNELIKETIMCKESSAVFVESVRLKACNFGTLQWIQSASAFFQYTLGRNIESQIIIVNFNKLLSFYNIVDSVHRRYSGEKHNMFTPRNSPEGIEYIMLICDNITYLASQNVYSSEEIAELAKIIAPLILFILYSDYPVNIESVLKDLAENLYVPKCLDVFLSLYTSIDSLSYLRLKYPKELGTAATNIIDIIYAILGDNMPDSETIKRSIANFNEAVLFNSSVRKRTESAIKQLTIYIRIVMSFVKITESLNNLLNKQRISAQDSIRAITEYNQISAIIEQINEMKKYDIIMPEKLEVINLYIDAMSSLITSKHYAFIYKHSVDGDFRKTTSRFRVTDKFTKMDYLYNTFVSIKPTLQGFMSRCRQLQLPELEKAINDITDHLYKFAITGENRLLYQVEDCISFDLKNLLSINKFGINSENIFEVSIFKKQLMIFLGKLRPIRYIYEIKDYPPGDKEQDCSLLIANLSSSFSKYLDDVGENATEDEKKLASYINDFATPSFVNFLSLASKISVDDINKAKIAEAKDIRESLQKELNDIATVSNKLDLVAKEKAKAASAKRESLKNEIKAAEEKQEEYDREIKELLSEKESLEKEKEMLASLGNGTGKLQLDNDVSSVISHLLKENETLSDYSNKPPSESDLILEQLQEAIRANVRLKKSIQMMKFPQESAVFTPEEFEKITSKIMEHKVKTTPFSQQYNKESVNLRMQLRDLQAEKNSLLNQIQTKPSKNASHRDYKTSQLYQNMVELSKISSAKDYREQFLEFGEVSDKFFLEISAEIKELEDEIAKLKSKRQRK